MKAFIVCNILFNKIDTRMLFIFLNSNVNWIFWAVVIIWIFVCFDTKWMESIFKEITKWIGDFRFIWNYLIVFYLLYLRERCNFVGQKWFYSFTEFFCYQWHYLNLAFHKIFFLSFLYNFASEIYLLFIRF